MKAKILLLAVLLIGLFMFVTPVQAAFGMQDDPPMEIPKLTADLLWGLTGSVLSILAWVIPPFRKWQEKWGEWTPTYMSCALLLLAVGYQFVWCQYDLNCLLANWQTVLMIAGAAIAANYLAYKGIVKPAKVRLLRARAINLARETYMRS